MPDLVVHPAKRPLTGSVPVPGDKSIAHRAILLAGLALSIFEIIQAQNLRPFVLFGALVMVVASGAWLLYDHR